MRLAVCMFCLLILSVFCAAQSAETNFPMGPQYLITNGTPEFLRSIATPSLSFNSPLAPAPVVATETGTLEPSTPPPVIDTQTALPEILWGEIKPSTIEITSTSTVMNAPPSLFDAGVTGFFNSQSVRDRDIGVSLAQAAAYWKAHKTLVSRLYTNADIERLHGS
jgi:hypothetical protein